MNFIAHSLRLIAFVYVSLALDEFMCLWPIANTDDSEVMFLSGNLRILKILTYK